MPGAEAAESGPVHALHPIQGRQAGWFHPRRDAAKSLICPRVMQVVKDADVARLMILAQDLGKRPPISGSPHQPAVGVEDRSWHFI